MGERDNYVEPNYGRIRKLEIIIASTVATLLVIAGIRLPLSVFLADRSSTHLLPPPGAPVSPEAPPTPSESKLDLGDSGELQPPVAPPTSTPPPPNG